MPLTVGTAGHIDHGKTWLVRALTGKDTDRLPEEQRRGISIDLGYAPLELPDGRRLSLVDVPGHERFVRTMIAGRDRHRPLPARDRRAGGRAPADARASCRAAAARRRPRRGRCHEGRRRRPETLELALDGSARARAGHRRRRRLREDRRRARRPSRRARARAGRRAAIGSSDAPLRRPCLHAARRRDRRHRNALVRRDRRRRRASRRACRARRARAQRAGARRRRRARRRRATRRRQPARPRAARASRAATCSSSPATIPSPIGSTSGSTTLAEVPAAVTVHVGTTATAARVVRDGDFAQLRLAEPVVAARGDHVILRTETTVAGGTVLDPSPPRRLDADAARSARQRNARRDRARARPRAGHRTRAAGARTARAERARGGLAAVLAAGEHYFSEDWLDELRADVRRRLTAQQAAEPARPGRVARRAAARASRGRRSSLNLLGVERRGAKAYLPGPRRASASKRRRPRSSRRSSSRRRSASSTTAARSVPRGTWAGCGASATDSPSRPTSTTAAARCSPTLDPITLAAFRDALGVGRQTAQLLLERYDADGLTLRRGDLRTLRRSGSRDPGSG